MTKEEFLTHVPMLLDDNHLDEAKIFLDKLSVLDDKDFRTQFFIGLYHLKKEEFELAIPHFVLVANLSDQNIYIPRSLKLLAYCYLKMENFWEAKELIENLLTEDSDSDNQLKNMLAYSLYGLKQFKDSFTLYKDIVKESPNNLTALNALSYLCAEHYNKPKEAIRILEPVLNDDIRLLDTIGWAYFKTGDFEKAELYVRQAFEKNPSHQVINNHMTTIIASL